MKMCAAWRHKSHEHAAPPAADILTPGGGNQLRVQNGSLDPGSTRDTSQSQGQSTAFHDRIAMQTERDSMARDMDSGGGKSAVAAALRFARAESVEQVVGREGSEASLDDGLDDELYEGTASEPNRGSSKTGIESGGAALSSAVMRIVDAFRAEQSQLTQLMESLAADQRELRNDMRKLLATPPDQSRPAPVSGPD